MTTVRYSDEHFSAMVQRAMDELSPDHMQAMEHVAIVIAEEPSEEQREALRLRGDQTLLGLYEGIPLTHRTGYESGVLADTITIFKQPHLASIRSDTELYPLVKRTVWHEIAHYFGLSHEQMGKLQRSRD